MIVPSSNGTMSARMIELPRRCPSVTQKWPSESSAVTPAGGVARRGQIAPVEAPESFRERPSRSSARDGSNAPFYCAIIHGLSGLARLHDR